MTLSDAQPQGDALVAGWQRHGFTLHEGGVTALWRVCPQQCLTDSYTCPSALLLWSSVCSEHSFVSFSCAVFFPCTSLHLMAAFGLMFVNLLEKKLRQDKYKKKGRGWFRQGQVTRVSASLLDQRLTGASPSVAARCRACWQFFANAEMFGAALSSPVHVLGGARLVPAQPRLSASLSLRAQAFMCDSLHQLERCGGRL